MQTSGKQGVSIRRPLLWGSLVALLAVAALALWVSINGELRPAAADADQAIIALVLPDEEGTVIPRTIMHAEGVGAQPTIHHADPRSPATIPGTTYDELRDAYPFGGGSLLAGTLLETTATPSGAPVSQPDDRPRPAHIVVDQSALSALAAGAGQATAFDLDIPEHMEVFDGERLHTFAEGPARVPFDELPALFAGAEYLSAEERESIRIQVAEALAGLLRANGAAAAQLVETDLAEEQFATVVAALPGD